MTPTILLYCIIAIVVGEFAFSKYLNWLNDRARSETLPPEAEGIYSAEEYARSQAYAKAKAPVGFWSSLLSFVLSIGLLASGGFGYLAELTAQWSDNAYAQMLSFLGLFGGASALISLPFAYYSQFVIEERFGFNKSTIALFITDTIKSWLLGAIIGGGLLCTMLYIYTQFPDQFWWMAFTLVASFSLFMGIFYTDLLLPLFNKLSPLDEGELQSAITRYAQKEDFPMKEIYVMDGSKRSSKANAFFSGLGGKKTIVLYDTLIEKLNTDEILAVLAHEVGHYKYKHILKSMCVSMPMMALTFYVLGWSLDSPLLSSALGAEQSSFHLGLLAFSLLYSPVSTLSAIAQNFLSRRFEYEADDFAHRTFGGQHLIDALIKLSKDSLSNLTPHPWYVKINYSHPSLLQRQAALQHKMHPVKN